MKGLGIRIPACENNGNKLVDLGGGRFDGW